MSTLIDGYPGERALDFCLIVALGVGLLSSAAWVAARRLGRKPATRHLVLVTALICGLAMPVLAAAFAASGWTLIAIPVLPAQPAELISDSTRVMAVSARVAPAPQPPDLGFSILDLGFPGRSDFSNPKSAIPNPKSSGVAGVAAGAAGKPPGGFVDRAEGPAAHRGAATLALIFWGCGSMLLLLSLARSCWLVRQLRRSASPLRDGSLDQLLDDVGRGLGVRELPRVVVSRRVRTPIAAGWWRPIVVLPERLIGAVSDDEMRDVLVHEVAHIRRRDHLIVLLQELARALYWPIVPVHGLIRELARAREELCDNYVLQSRDALSYGATLLHLAELSMDARPMRATVGILHWKGELERRIKGLLDQGRSTMTRSSRWLACVVALAFIAGGMIAAATRFSESGSSAATPQARAPKAAADAQPPQNAQAKRSILIQVVGPAGRPMRGVEVRGSIWTRKPIQSANGRRAVSDDLGQVHFELPEGISIFRVWARAKGYVPLFAHWEEEDDPERSLPEAFTFRLEPGTVIGGIVRNQDGRPIQGATVEVALQSGGEREGRTGPDKWLAEQDPRPNRSTALLTDAEGRWTLDNVPPGDDVKVQLKFSHPDYISDLKGTLQEEQDVDLAALRARTATITMRGGLTVTGTVTDPEGQTIAGAVVVRGENPYLEWGSQEVRTNDQGVYRLPPLPRGPLTITVVAPVWMPMQKKIDLQPGLKPVDFALEPGKELRIRFVDRLGQPIPGVGVMIVKWRGNEALYNHRHSSVLNTQIPNQASDAGLYQWTWAPDDAVTYRFGKRGYVDRNADLIADGTEQTITLQAILRITGKVTDAATGRPIEKVTAIPVAERSPGRLFVERQHKKVFPGGAYAIEGDRNRDDVAFRVRIEAEGYRTAMSDSVRIGAFQPTVDFRLEPAPPVRGRVVDGPGRPVAGARVYLATSSQVLGIENQDENGWSSNQKVVTDGQGAFSLPAQFERYALIAIHDAGYAEVHLEPDQQPGELALKAWAKVEGRLLQAGQPVPVAWIFLQPVRLSGGGSPHIQDGLSVKTDRAGHFVFPRMPPVKSCLGAFLSVWRESPIASSRSVPLDLKPGQHVAVDLPGEGTSITGRVVPSGDASARTDLHKSLNYLVRKVPGIEPPAELRSLGFDARGGWSHVWTSTPEGLAYLQTLDHYFVTLDKDGRLQISGVPAGDYDLAIRLYEPPGEGCLVSPVGSRVVSFRVTEEAARGAGLDLGTIEVKTALGPRPGEVVPDFAFVTFSGDTVKLSDLRGRYVLLDFWATWCRPCVANLPALGRLHDTYGSGKGLVVLGLNLDKDRGEARRFVESRKLPGSQGWLGSSSDDPVLERYAISFVPSYFLIGPDGKLIHKGADLDEIGAVVRRVLR